MSLPKVPGGGTAGVGMRGLPAAPDTEGRLADTMVLRRAEREEGSGGGAVNTARIGQKACADSCGFLTG